MSKINIDEIKKLPNSFFKKIIKKAKIFLKKDKTMINIFKKYNFDVNIIDLIPTYFDDLDVSAKTDHGVVILNYKLLQDGDFFKDYSYLIHEYTHWAQQCLGNKPTQSANDGSYLHNKYEQEGFKNQVEYIANHFGDENAEKYVDNLLNYHNIKTKKEKDKLEAILTENI